MSHAPGTVNAAQDLEDLLQFPVLDSRLSRYILEKSGDILQPHVLRLMSPIAVRPGMVVVVVYPVFDDLAELVRVRKSSDAPLCAVLRMGALIAVMMLVLMLVMVMIVVMMVTLVMAMAHDFSLPVAIDPSCALC